MTDLYQKIKQLSRALEGVNIDTLRELESHLESREVPPAVRSRQAASRRVAYCERKRGFGASDAPAMPGLKLAGQR